jgi:hypothetical protein
LLEKARVFWTISEKKPSFFEGQGGRRPTPGFEKKKSKGSTYMAAIWAKKIKIKAKAAYTTFSLITTLTITIPKFQPRVVNSQNNTFVNISQST